MMQSDPAGFESTEVIETTQNGPMEELIDPSIFYQPEEQKNGTSEELVMQSLDELDNPVIPKLPIIPKKIVIPRHRVSGRYRGRTGNFELELRVDVDKTRRMNRVSGDFYYYSGFTRTYFGSFIINSPSIAYGISLVRIQGTISATFGTAFPYIRISIPRNSVFSSKRDAAFRFYRNPTAGAGALYSCNFESNHFRTVLYEQDRVLGIDSFQNYNTASLPSGGSNRNISVSSAFQEAGVDLVNTGGTNIVSTSPIGTAWSNAELHLAMQNNFSLWANDPSWRVWLLEASRHDIGAGLYGIMFDQQGKQRQGCAVFHQGIGGSSRERRRLQLYTYVHELGHCFNLLHSWQKSLATPSVPNRPSSLSWMNYPWNSSFPSPNSFWNNFAFQFDNQEVIHLRHAFRNNIIMGGNNFTVGSALEESNHNFSIFQNTVEDRSGLNLRIEARKSYALGEPVVLDLKLGSTVPSNIKINTRLHPNFEYTTIAIKSPSGKVHSYHPMIKHLATTEEIVLNKEKPAIYESAYIGYGKDGFTFEEPGLYSVKAAYSSLDNSIIVSNEIKIRIKYPVTVAEQDIAELYMGEEQGQLFYMLGSDSPYLENGNNAFDQVIKKYSSNPLSAYAALVKGINASREFKTILSDKTLQVRKSKVTENEKMIKLMADHSKGDQGIDDITLNMAFRNMASCQEKSGNKKAAKKTMEDMISFFKKKGLRSEVLKVITDQAQELLD